MAVFQSMINDNNVIRDRLLESETEYKHRGEGGNPTRFALGSRTSTARGLLIHEQERSLVAVAPPGACAGEV